MVDARDVGAGDRFKAELRPVVGMRAPVHVVQQAGRQDQPVLGRRLVGVAGFYPVVQRRAEARAARRGRLHVAACLDQRIEDAHPLGHLAVEQALAQAVGRDRHAFRVDALDQLRQHQARQRDQRQPLRRCPGHRGHLGLILLADPLQRLEELRDRRLVAVQHLQRVPGPLHVEPGDRAPGPADEEEPPRHAGHRLAQRLDALPDRLHPLAVVGDVGELQRTEGRGAAGEDLALRQVRELHRRAAHVADEAVGVRPAEQHPLGREPRLLRAARHVELQPGLELDLVTECRSVGRLAHRRRRHRDHAEELHPGPASAAKWSSAARALIQPSGSAAPVSLRPGAEAAEHLLVVEVGRAAGHAVEDDETHRVRADVDDADPASAAALAGSSSAQPRQRLDVALLASALVPPPLVARRGPRCRTRPAPASIVAVHELDHVSRPRPAAAARATGSP